MARDESPPFPRGGTYFGGNTADSTSGAHYEGKEYVFEDKDYSATAGGASSIRTNRFVRCRIVRNVAAAALLPSRLVTYRASGDYGAAVDGYARTTAADYAGVTDEWLPAAGVPVNDLFYIVIEGPTTVYSDLAGGANNVLTVGLKVVALTAATSGATTAGRIAPQDLTGATSVLADQIQHKVGAACTAKTTANTNTLVLIEVAKLK